MFGKNSQKNPFRNHPNRDRRRIYASRATNHAPFHTHFHTGVPMSNYLTIIAITLALSLSIATADIAVGNSDTISICGDPGNNNNPPPQQ